MGGYFGGLLEGFQDRRGQEYERNLQQDQLRRQSEGRMYEYLLQSNDPQIRALALSGLFESVQPGSRAKGLRGFMGEVQGGSIYPQILRYMNELVPAEGVGGGPAPPAPGGAAMPTNQPVRTGSAPIPPTAAGVPGPPAAPPGIGARMHSPADAALGMGGGGGVPVDPTGGPGVSSGPGGVPSLIGAPPPPSRFKRRGTGVPTAEEIAETNARIPLQTRINLARQQLQAAGATPDEIQQAIMGILGAPQNQRMLSTVTGWGVRLPGQETVQPVLLDQNKGGYVLPGGQPLPPGAEMVRMSGAGAGGSLTSTVKDSPDARVQLLNMGADPDILNAGTTDGYWRVQQRGDGTVLVQGGVFVPPPEFAGGGVVAEPGTGVPVRTQFPREGGPAVVVGDDPTQVTSTLQNQAKALLAAVDKRAQTERLGSLPFRPGQLDQIVVQEAQRLNLPWKTYADVQQAAIATAPVTQRQQSEGGSTAERVRRRALENRGLGGRPAEPAPSPPPPGPPVPQPSGGVPLGPTRSRGPGPRGSQTR